MNSFRRNVIEMTLSMVVPWSAFFLIVNFALPAAGLTLAWFVLAPISIVVMVVPMSAFMLYRHASGRDIVEMNASMFAGMLVAIPILRFVLPTMGVQLSLDVIFPIALFAMTAPMVALMFLRRDRHMHHVQGELA